MHRSPTLQRARKKTGPVQSQRVKGEVVIQVPQPRKVNRARLRRPLDPPLRVHHHLQPPQPPQHLQPHQLLHLHLRQALRVRARITSPVWASIHPVWRRGSSFPYAEYAQSSRLARLHLSTQTGEVILARTLQTKYHDGQAPNGSASR